MPPLELKKVVLVELRSVGLDERCSMENPALATTESTSGSASSASTKACCSSISSLPCALILLDNLAEVLTYRFCQERYRKDFAFVQASPPESLGLRCPIRILPLSQNSLRHSHASSPSELNRKSSGRQRSEGGFVWNGALRRTSLRASQSDRHLSCSRIVVGGNPSTNRVRVAPRD